MSCCRATSPTMPRNRVPQLPDKAGGGRQARAVRTLYALQEIPVEHSYVVARTTGAHRKYYFRRRESNTWTPWQQIKLDIEDVPVIPVVWKDRLFLFWLKIVQQAPANPETSQPDPNDKDHSRRFDVLGDPI